MAAKVFRFRSFAEQVASIKIDVVHRVTTLSDLPDHGKQTFFHEALSRWREVNCSIPFDKFYRDVIEVAQSLPQLVYHKKEVIDEIKHHLANKDPLELEPLLDLIVQFARDLQADFYPYFKDVFPLLISLCHTQDATLIERVFMCLAYLFKYLWRHMLQDLTNLFRLYSTLLVSSQRPHLRKFAVESFGFLLRKIQDTAGLCNLLFTSILNNTELVDGIAKLMFEICKGVQKQFHSCTEKFLPVVYDTMNSVQFVTNEDIISAVCKMTELMASYTCGEFSLPTWKPLLVSVENAIKIWSEDQSDANSLGVAHLLHLIGIMTSWNKGARVTHSISQWLCTILFNFVQDPSLSSNSHLPSVTLHLVTSILLLQSSFSVCEPTIEEIVQCIFDKWVCVDKLTEFTLELLMNGCDNSDKVLSHCLRYCETKGNNQENWYTLLLFFTRLSDYIDQQSLSLLNGFNAGSFSNIILMLISLLKQEMNKLSQFKENFGKQDFSISWSALKCIQLIKCIPKELLEYVRKFFSSVYQIILTNLQCYDLLIVTSQCIQTLSVIDDMLLDTISLEISLNLLKYHPTNLPMLQSLYSYYNVVKKSDAHVLCHEQLITLLPMLIENISCPSNSLRFVTLQILYIFPLLSSSNEDNFLCSVLEYCLQVEKVPTTLTTYRNKLIWLSKLKYVPHKFSLFPDCYKEIPLRYLLGMLYVDFSLLWEPIFDLISTYACIELNEMFWSVFGKALQSVSSLQYDVKVRSIDETSMDLSPIAKLFHSYRNQTQILECGDPDCINYRQLLWRCMEKFIKISEAWSRIFVPLFYEFIEKEYGLTDEMLINTQDIGVRGESCNTEGDEYDNTTKRKPKRYKGGRNKTLVCMLTVLSKCTSVQSIYHHKDLQNLYIKLLMDSDKKIQKLALSCLANYRLCFLLPYLENLESLLDDRLIKEQLLLLGSSTDNSIVAKEHVDGLVSILVRLLYGRMKCKSITPSRKQSLVHSLAACGEKEISEYIQIIIAPFKHQQNCSNPVTVHSVFPLKLQLSFLHEIKRIISVISHQFQPHLSTVLPILFSLTKLCNMLLNEHRQQVDSQFINSLKTIRQSLFSLITELLDTFYYIDLSSYQDDLLTSLVWPQLLKLPQECIQYPTPLLKLLHSWSLHKQLCYLFDSSLPDTYNQSLKCPILHFLYQCLFTDGVSTDVCSMILELTINIVKHDESDEEMSVDDGTTMQLGTELIKPFVPTLMMYLRSIVKSKQQKMLLQLAFQILSWISCHITENIEADLLIEMLLPFLYNSNQNKNDDCQILTTIWNLISHASSINKHYNSLFKLFSVVDARQSREILCNILSKISTTKDEKLVQTADIVSMINSWDPCQIEEPDYEVREEGFAKAKELLQSIKLKSKTGLCHINLVLPIVHNALYFIHQSDDISIRDSASSFLSSIIQTVDFTDVQAFEIIILGTLLPSLKSGLRAKKEVTINEFVDILSQLVVKYSTHSQFVDLVHLSHLDPEVNFFKNVCHIQLHRRTKAFRRLITICSKNDFSQNTMMSYLLPLSSYVVFSPLTSREHNMLQEAINVIGVISSKLKWNNYYNLLKHYLHQLTHCCLDIHRNIIRTVVAILDNFHFTISEPSAGKEDDDAGLSERIHKSIVGFVLPCLESCLTLKSELPHHRLSHKDDNFEGLKLRVPIAIAMTKLLLCLPQSSVELHLPSLLLKVCQTLKNRAQDIRDISRTTLLKMSQSLGPKYFQFITKELKSTLTRGYQLHVLSYTIYYLLHGLTSILKPGDLDSCLNDFKEILINDLFGSPSEERNVNEFISKISEGKKCKSAHAYGLVTRFLSPSLLPSLLQPLQETLESQTTFKKVAVCEEVLKKVVYGILSNKSFIPQTLLLFVHGIVNQTILPLQPRPTLLVDDMPPVDSQLLPPKPSRTKHCSVHETDIAVHLFTHFGLQLLAVSLRKDKFKSPSQEILEMLDALVPLLTEVLKTRHVKLLSTALQCIIKFLSLPLSSLKKCIPTIASHLFDVLKYYSYIGAVCTDNNQELVATAFKSMTKIIQDFTYYHISEDELKLLLSYIEQDIHDYKRQSTAFPLLKAILTRKFNNPVIHDVMKKISETVVNGDSNKVRVNSRHVLLQFLMTYDLKKQTNCYFDFFLANISYEEQCGRESVIEMINLIFNKFPTSILETHVTYFFIPLVSQLINDDSALCRRMITELLKTLLNKVGKEPRNDIVTMIIDWFSHSKLIHKQLAIQSLGIITDIEGKKFDSRLCVFLPLICDSLREAVSNTTSSTENKETDDEMDIEDISLNDHFLFTVLTVLENIFINCGVDICNADLFQTSCDIWDTIEKHLLHPHNWVRQASSKLFNILFTSVNIDDLVTHLLDQKHMPEKICCYFFVNGGGLTKVRDLQQLFLTQLKAPVLSADTANEAIKNLVYIATLLFKLSSHIKNCKRKRKSTVQKLLKKRKLNIKNDYLETFREIDENEKLTAEGLLIELIHQLDKLCRYESGHNPKASLKRMYVFQWIGAFATVMGVNCTNAILVQLLKPLYKELNDTKKRAGEELHHMANEVIEQVRETCGKEAFSLAYSETLSIVQSLKTERKVKHVKIQLLKQQS